MGSCVTTLAELFSRDSKFSGEKTVFITWVKTAEIVQVIASTSDTVPRDELEAFGWPAWL